MAVIRICCASLGVLILTGCPGAAFKPADNKASPAAATPEAAAGQPQAEPAAPAPAEAAPPPNALNREAELVDRRAYLQEHPNAVEIEKNVIDATDPFSASAQAYFSGVSSLMKSTYEYDLRLQKQLNDDKWPTFAKYKEILDNAGVKLKGLKLRQVYAYDDQTGKISILELPEEPAP